MSNDSLDQGKGVKISENSQKTGRKLPEISSKFHNNQIFLENSWKTRRKLPEISIFMEFQ